MWDELSFVQGKLRKACLLALENGPKTPSLISRALGANLSHVSRALRELEAKGLVKCMTKAPKNRIYQITDDGSELLRLMKKMERP